jgi:hypothetical protein
MPWKAGHRIFVDGGNNPRAIEFSFDGNDPSLRSGKNKQNSSPQDHLLGIQQDFSGAGGGSQLEGAFRLVSEYERQKMR